MSSVREGSSHSVTAWIIMASDDLDHRCFGGRCRYDLSGQTEAARIVDFILFNLARSPKTKSSRIFDGAAPLVDLAHTAGRVCRSDRRRSCSAKAQQRR